MVSAIRQARRERQAAHISTMEEENKEETPEEEQPQLNETGA